MFSRSTQSVQLQLEVDGRILRGEYVVGIYFNFDKYWELPTPFSGWCCTRNFPYLYRCKTESVGSCESITMDVVASLLSIINSTARRVPLIIGLPTRIFGSTTILSCQFTIDRLTYNLFTSLPCYK
jgi:hypothetical protein